MLLAGQVVAGYYSLTYSQVSREQLPSAVSAEMPEQYAVPVLLLARLAVDKRYKGRGLGVALLKDALLRALSAGEIAGLRAVLAHAIDETAAAFYEHFGFVRSPVSELHMMLDIRTLQHNRSPEANRATTEE